MNATASSARWFGVWMLAAAPLLAQVQQATVTQAPVQAQPALRLDIPHSYSPIGPYRATLVPQPNLSNSIRIETLIKDGVLDLSLKDAISLALENNLDIAIARYNLPIAAADILRTQAGGLFRGVNTGVVQNTPGGGVGGFGSAASGAGAGGTSGGAGGAGSGASGLVSSTLGAGTNVSSYDPIISGSLNNEHYTQPLSNTSIYGTQTLQQNTTNGNIGFSEAFPTGTSFSAIFDNNRGATNSPNSFLNPTLNSYYHVALQQQLLAGFGFGPNLRYLRIAKNNQKISDAAFKLQVVTTVTQIENMYWDLVAAYEDEGVKQRSLDFAQQTLESGKKQLALQAIPAMDVMKDEGEVASREQDLTIAKTTLQFQELLIKNALTKNLDDPILEAMPVRPTDESTMKDTAAQGQTEDMIARALHDRIELYESDVDLENRQISRRAARNALLPSVALTAFYGGTGLAGLPNPTSSIVSTAPPDFGGAVRNAFNNTAPDYYVGLSVEYSDSQPRGEVGPVPLGVGDAAGGVAVAAVEEADSHRGAKCAVCVDAERGAGGVGTERPRSGTEDIRYYGEGARARGGVELPDFDGAARPGSGGVYAGSSDDGLSEGTD